jgi:hypothetical protein
MKSCQKYTVANAQDFGLRIGGQTHTGYDARKEEHEGYFYIGLVR